MNQIKTFAEFKKLPNNTEVNCIVGGEIETYVIIGTITSSEGVAVVNKTSYKNLKFLYKDDVEPAYPKKYNHNKPFWTLEYDLEEAGRLMIQQIEQHALNEIEAITAVYLKKSIK